MTTMELNLRKQNFIEFVDSADEEVIYELEKCIDKYEAWWYYKFIKKKQEIKS